MKVCTRIINKKVGVKKQQCILYYAFHAIHSMNSVLNKYNTFKKVNKLKLTFKIKPWVTSDIQKLICIKKNYKKKVIIKQDPKKGCFS